ncbi:hypothetical protein [Nonomuraea sp. NPDC049695]|uniref:hypothetical protein n=1 Tax=Nonomuraea sp. NPDC049695 TaxID=3154734 RepID=UPI003416894C
MRNAIDAAMVADLHEVCAEPAYACDLAGRVLSAAEALAVRLVNEVVPEDELPAAADRPAARIAKNAPPALRSA